MKEFTAWEKKKSPFKGGMITLDIIFFPFPYTKGRVYLKKSVVAEIFVDEAWYLNKLPTR